MKKQMRIALLTCVAAAGIPIIADYEISLPEQKVSVTEWDQEVYVGNEFSVGNLAAWGSTGYSWSQLIEEKEPIEFVRTQAKKINYKPMPGSPPPDTDYFFKATKPGNFTLRFIHTGPGLVPNHISDFKIIHLKAIPKKQVRHVIQTKNKKEYAVTFPAKKIDVYELEDIAVTVGKEFNVQRSAGHCSYIANIGPAHHGIELVGYLADQPASWIFNATKEPANAYERENTYLRFMNVQYDQGKPVDVLGYKTQRVKIK